MKKHPKPTKTKSERLQIVIDIVKKLKSFPKSYVALGDPTPFIDLYNEEYDAIKQLKKIFDAYINQNDEDQTSLQSFSGKIPFPELNRTIEYILPIRKITQPTFVLRHKETTKR